MLNYLEPIIESNSRRDHTRSRQAEKICKYLDKKAVRPDDFYQACESLLANEYSQRILLYLPFKVLEDAPTSFRKTYMEAWNRLLHVQDVRENFHRGDILEKSARSKKDHDRVVKCAHLTPWLVKYGFLSISQLEKTIDKNVDSPILVLSFSETFRFLKDMGILSSAERSQLIDIEKRIDTLKTWMRKMSKDSPLERQTPRFNSEKRQKWLNEMSRDAFLLLSPKADLSNPFKTTNNVVLPIVKEISKGLKPGEIALFGGSIVKGYGTQESDRDVFYYNEIIKDRKKKPGDPNVAHIYLNSYWIGAKGDEKVFEAREYIRRCYESGDRLKQTMEKIEMDLCQYRLLHKGYERVKKEREFETSDYTEMDGDCPFYDDEYRKIATKLFAKYVWL